VRIARCAFSDGLCAPTSGADSLAIRITTHSSTHKLHVIGITTCWLSHWSVSQWSKPAATKTCQASPPASVSAAVLVNLTRCILTQAHNQCRHRPATARRANLVYKPVASFLNKHKAITSIALLTFVATLVWTVLSLQNDQGDKLSWKETRETLWRKLYGWSRRIRDQVYRARQEKQAKRVAMPFDDAENDNWGVCSLQAVKRLGKSNYMEYTFSLPQSNYVLPLDLGQTIKLMFLNKENKVVQADFFPYVKSSTPQAGSFSILLPGKSSSYESNVANLGVETANIIRSLQYEFQPGDEIALQPGSNRLSYKGQYLPVTDMVYIASELGIVPVLDQVRSVLPSGSSSVKGVTVVWINEETKDFDVTADLLEQEYFKYSSKLAVSCIVENLRLKDFGDNEEIRAAIPPFRQGTMAVLAGPSEVMRKAVAYLERLGYPKDTICVL
jgi:hypothetical protein